MRKSVWNRLEALEEKHRRRDSHNNEERFHFSDHLLSDGEEVHLVQAVLSRQCDLEQAAKHALTEAELLEDEVFEQRCRAVLSWQEAHGGSSAGKPPASRTEMTQAEFEALIRRDAKEKEED